MELRKRIDEWFKYIDNEQVTWLLQQLHKKGLITIGRFEQREIEQDKFAVKKYLMTLGETDQTHSFINNLKSNWSSVKHRRSLKNNKSNINYWISKPAYKELDCLSREMNATKEKAIEALITQEYSLQKKQADEEKIRIKNEKTEKQRKRIRRLNGIDDGEILLANKKIVKSLQDSENNLKLELEALKLELTQSKEIAVEQRIKIAEYTVMLNSFDYLEEELNVEQKKAVQDLIHNTNEEPKV